MNVILTLLIVMIVFTCLGQSLDIHLATRTIKEHQRKRESFTRGGLFVLQFPSEPISIHLLSKLRQIIGRDALIDIVPYRSVVVTIEAEAQFDEIAQMQGLSHVEALSDSDIFFSFDRWHNATHSGEEEGIYVILSHATRIEDVDLIMQQFGVEFWLTSSVGAENGDATYGTILELRCRCGDSKSIIEEIKSTFPMWLMRVGVIPPAFGANDDAVGNTMREILIKQSDDNYSPLLGLTGANQLIAVSDNGLDTSSCFFQDAAVSGDDLVASVSPNDVEAHTPIKDALHRKVRVFWQHRNNGLRPDSHGTQVCGVATGSSLHADSSRHNGMAPDARIVFMDTGAGFASVPSAFNPFAYKYGARVHSGSWVLGPRDNYADAFLPERYDQFLYDNRDFFIVMAAGNGNSGHVRYPCASKSVVCVGATNPKNPQGDFRMYSQSLPGSASLEFEKPDVLGIGVGVQTANVGICETRLTVGTSLATPMISGAAVLLREYFADKELSNDALGRHGAGGGTTPMGSLLRAMLVTAANNIALVNRGARLANRLEQGNGIVFLDTIVGERVDTRILANENVAIQTEDDVAYTCVAIDGVANISSLAGSRLDITMAYTDVPGGQIVNNLRLRVSDIDGRLLSVNGKNDGEEENRSTVERVRTDGKFAFVAVDASSLTCAQDFSLVVSLRSSFLGGEKPGDLIIYENLQIGGRGACFHPTTGICTKMTAKCLCDAQAGIFLGSAAPCVDCIADEHCMDGKVCSNGTCVECRAKASCAQDTNDNLCIDNVCKQCSIATNLCDPGQCALVDGNGNEYCISFNGSCSRGISEGQCNVIVTGGPTDVDVSAYSKTYSSCRITVLDNALTSFIVLNNNGESIDFHACGAFVFTPSSKKRQVDSMNGIAAAAGALALSSAVGDPHLRGAHGEAFDFFGIGGAIYNLFSTQEFVINILLGNVAENHFIVEIGVCFLGQCEQFTLARQRGPQTYINALNRKFGKVGGSARFPNEVQEIIELELCQGHRVILMKKVTTRGKRVGYFDVEVEMPGCHDDFDGALGQTYKCKYAEHKEEFVFDRSMEAHFRVDSLKSPFGGYNGTNASCGSFKSQGEIYGKLQH